MFTAIIIIPLLLTGIAYGIVSFSQSNDICSFGSPILNKSSYSALESKKNINSPDTIALKSETTESSQISAEEINFLLTESLNELAQKNKEIQNSKNDAKIQKIRVNLPRIRPILPYRKVRSRIRIIWKPDCSSLSTI